ncbi:MAG: superoxide dismutase family protein [Vulcanimicrobiaceae bacterium]
MTPRTFATVATACALLAFSAGSPRSAAAAGPPTFAAYIVDTTGKEVGRATFVGVDTGGVLVRIDTQGLTPGKHGMHVHETGSCNALRDAAGNATPFGAAGGHFDPADSKHHLGPSGMGHAGDLPNLAATDAGHARTTFYTDRLSVTTGAPNNIVGRAIVVHANEDNYTDEPPLGGSGGRVECGEIGPLRS